MNKLKIKYLLFFLLNSLYAVQLLSPNNNATLNYTHVLFEWEQDNDVNTYTIYLDTDTNFSNPIIVNNNSLIYIDTNNLNWNTTYYWKVRPEYKNESGNWSNTFSFATGTKKSTAYSLNSNDTLYQPGVTLFSSFFNYFSAIIDQNGNEIWNTGDKSIVYYNTDFYGQFFGCYVDNDIENYLPGIEFDINSNYIWEEPNDEFLHHELIKLPDGNYMGLIETIELGPIPIGPWTNLFLSLGYQADGIKNEFPWVGDKIVIWDKDTKQIIWEWNSFNHFSMDDYDTLGSSWFEGFGNNRYDWTHANAFYPTFDELGDLEFIYLSSRHLSRITKINASNGNIIWNIGMDLPSGDVDCGQDIGFSWQHSITITDEGNIVTLDNGNISQTLLNTDYATTRGLEISVTENENGCIANTVWEYSLPEDYFGFASGNVQKLDNGNYLIVTVGSGGTALEVDSNNNHIWEGKLNLQLPNGAVYRANRLSGLYPVAFSTIFSNTISESLEGLSVNSYDENINFKLYNNGSSEETYNIFIKYDESPYSLNQSSTLQTNKFDNITFNHNNANEINVKIVPSHRTDLEKNISFTVNSINCNHMDLNNNTSIDITDIVALVELVLNPYFPTYEELCLGDLNSDFSINVIDIIALVQYVLNN